MTAISSILDAIWKPGGRRFRLYETIANFHQFSILHTLVAITLCYHLVFSPEAGLSPEARNLLILLLLVTTAAIWRVPPRLFGAGWFVGGWVLGDTLLTVAVIFLSGHTGSALYVAFFLIILLAAFAQSLKQTLLLSTVLCVGYGAVLYVEGTIGSFSLQEDRLLQIPLLLVVATFYGHAVELLRRERVRQWTLANQRQKAQDALHESEERYRAVIEAATDAIIVADHGGRMVSWNTGAQRIFSYSEEEVLGKPLTFLFPAHQRPELERLDATGASTAVGRTVECAGLRRDGSEFPLELSVSTWQTVQGRFYGCIIRDITGRRRIEHVKEELEAQKQEALRRMAGGMAHDFNNLMTVIVGYSGMALSSLSAGHSAYSYVEQIKEAGTRAVELARHLLVFSRRHVLEPRVLDLNETLANLEETLRQLLGERIELVMTLDPALGRVKADPAHLAQAVLNLADNARDAMPEGGRLTVETANAQLADMLPPQDTGMGPGPYVKLTIGDTGLGMDAETRTRVFDPFFTTKALGKRTGLGLSTVYGIVKQSGGHIWVRSEPGQGTTFTICLPRVEDVGE
ncbi:MAG: PAS domain S-box protein [Nitrospirota bacterium]